MRLRWQGAGGERALDATLRDGAAAALRVAHRADPAELPPEGARVELTVTADRGVFSGPARVLRRDDDARALTVELLGALEAVQRRQYFRIDVALAAVTAAVFGPGGAPAGSVKAQVQNLSGGGLCFEGDRPLTREHSVALALALEEGPPLTVRCAVLEGAEVAPGRWRVRASFVGMPDRDRQRIVRQVQRLQLARERYRRGDGG